MQAVVRRIRVSSSLFALWAELTDLFGCTLPTRHTSAPFQILERMQFYDEMPNEDITEAFLWSRLEPCLTYLREADSATVRRALQWAIHAHEGQMRKSGEPFVSHPVEVTRILAQLQAERVCDCPTNFLQAVTQRWHDGSPTVDPCAGYVGCWASSRYG